MEKLNKEDKEIELIEKELDITKLENKQISEYKALTSNIKPGDDDSVLSFGSSISDAAEAASEQVLKHATLANSGQIGNTIKALTKTMHDVDLRDVSSLPLYKRLIINYLPGGKSLVNSIDNFMLNYESISQAIDNAREKFKADLIGYEEANNRMRDDIKRSAVYRAEYIKLIRSGEYDIQIKAKKIEEDFKNGKIDEFKHKQLVDWLNTYRRQIHTLKGKVAKLEISMGLLLEQKYDNIKMYQLTKELVYNHISDWKTEAARAVEARSMRIKAERLEEALGTTDKMFENTANEILDTSKKIAKLRQHEVNSVEMLKRVKDKLVSTAREVDKIESEREGKLAKADKDLDKLREDFKKEIAGIGNKLLGSSDDRQKYFSNDKDSDIVVADEFKALEVPEEKDEDK